MQFAVITGPTTDTASKRIELANKSCDGIELRLDLFKEQLNLDKLTSLKTQSRNKTILTLRKRNQGGGYLGPEDRRQSLLLDYLACNSEYVDIEWDTDSEFFLLIKRLYPNCKIISSFHDFISTPRDLEKIFTQMKSNDPYAYKICTTANSFADAYKMLRFIQKKVAEGTRIIGLCMGEYGSITRREGLKAGNYLNYTILHNRDSCAKGLAKKG